MGFSKFFRPASAPGAALLVPAGSLAAIQLEAKPEVDHRTQADCLDALCRAHDAKYTIQRHDALDSIVITVDLPLGQKIAVTGRDVAEAIALLVKKIREVVR